MKLTATQHAAMCWLNDLTGKYPWTKSRGLNGGHVGRRNAAVLRKLDPHGLVIIHRPTSNCYRYALTDAGRSALGACAQIGGTK